MLIYWRVNGTNKIRPYQTRNVCKVTEHHLRRWDSESPIDAVVACPGEGPTSYNLAWQINLYIYIYRSDKPQGFLAKAPVLIVKSTILLGKSQVCSWTSPISWLVDAWMFDPLLIFDGDLMATAPFLSWLSWIQLTMVRSLKCNILALKSTNTFFCGEIQLFHGEIVLPWDFPAIFDHRRVIPHYESSW